MPDKCPRCGSPAPHRHPAAQHEGEVEICFNEFHLLPSAQNTMGYINMVRAARKVVRSGCSEIAISKARAAQIEADLQKAGAAE